MAHDSSTKIKALLTSNYPHQERAPEMIADSVVGAWWALERELPTLAENLPALRRAAEKANQRARTARLAADQANAAVGCAEDKIRQICEAQDGLPRR